MCSSSQVYDSFSLRADSLMGEFKVGQFNIIKILNKISNNNNNSNNNCNFSCMYSWMLATSMMNQVSVSI